MFSSSSILLISEILKILKKEPNMQKRYNSAMSLYRSVIISTLVQLFKKLPKYKKVTAQNTKIFRKDEKNFICCTIRAHFCAIVKYITL